MFGLFLIVFAIIYGLLSIRALVEGFLWREYKLYMKIGHVLMPAYLVGYYFGVLCDTELEEVKDFFRGQKQQPALKRETREEKIWN